MNWKHDLRLSDLPPGERLEIVCRVCGKARYETAANLRAMPGLEQAYLDEAERALRCKDRYCKGSVRIARIHDGKTEGFVGGMA